LFLGFRVSPLTNRLVGDNGPGKRRGQTGSSKEINWVMDGGQALRKRFSKLSNFLAFIFKQILIEFKQMFKSFLEIETWN
jgi:hypothetical protein